MPGVIPLPKLPERDAGGHKGSFGTALLIGGSRGMSGAIALAGMAALRGGCGLTFLACPQSVLPLVAVQEPAYLTIPLAEDASGRLAFSAYTALQEQLDRSTAVGLGPGLGQSAELDQLVARLYREVPQPLVVDADALNALSRQPDLLADHAGPRIFTPHPGEMARLVQTTVQDVQENREVIAREFAQANRLVLVLKGQHSIITDGSRLAVNTTGNNGMATGGTGDVLTGLLTSLLAQEMAVYDAARVAVHVHGLAGDLAAAELGVRGLIASDLPRYLAYALKKLE